LSIGEPNTLRRTAGVLMAVGLAIGGCLEPAPTSLPAPSEAALTIAVAPALNHSGSSDLDAVQVADLFASELQSVRGVNVMGPNRVLAAMHTLGIDRIQSAEQATQIARALGAQRIAVVAITEYDPYDPPVVGMAAQLYDAERDPEGGSSPIIRAQVQRVYNAAHQPTVKAVREFADLRNAAGGPFGWRRYLVSQQLYLRFCCYSTVRELMRQEYWQSLPSPEPAA
jgi:hypothetical protein